MEQIYAVKSGRTNLNRAAVLQMLAHMKARGAQYFILGCTELPILAQMLGLEEAFVDPTALLARRAIEACGGRLAPTGK